MATASSALAPGLVRRQARDEAFDHALYNRLASRAGDPSTRALLERLSAQELRHLRFWLRLSGLERVGVSRVRLGLNLLLSRLLGTAFTIRRLERHEEKVIASYERILSSGALAPSDEAELRAILEDERRHEREMERQLSDERLRYLGSAVLGLNDALVELTGGLTGMVSSIRNTELIGFTALVVGLAASLSMASSNFLSAGMSEAESELRPGKAAAYTGVSYVLVVLLLVAPFFALEDRVAALAVSWVAAVAVILGFAYYSAVLQGVSLARRAAQMLALGGGVAVITFLVGRAVSAWVGIEV